MWVFYFFAAIVVWLGILSLRGGFRFAAHVKSELTRPLSDYTPFASVIVPCRGLDPGIEENLAALLRQTHSTYEVIFVTDSENDPVLGVIQNITKDSTVASRILIAGAADDSGQKVHNLRTAVAQIDPRSEVLVFADSDGRPHEGWLNSLVAPLADDKLGAATSYRWFVPSAGGFASRLRSVWNASIASALGPNRKTNFCWGGSSAIRRETFVRLKIRERWQGSVSDDFTMTRALNEAELPIYFVPACLVASKGDCDLAELLEFSNRQLKITRVYAPHLWKPVLLGSMLFCLVFFGGILLVVVRSIAGLSVTTAVVLLLIIFLLGAAKSFVRFSAVKLVMPSEAGGLRRDLLAQLLLWPISSLLYLCNALTASFSRRIEWRGIAYELKSADEVVIIRKREKRE